MKIKRLYINNYKSLVDFELIEPNPFSVFVGPNAAGKSNIFEALEFLSYAFKGSLIAPEMFEGPENFLNKQYFSKLNKLGIYSIDFKLNLDNYDLQLPITSFLTKDKLVVGAIGTTYNSKNLDGDSNKIEKIFKSKEEEFAKFFSRIFINQGKARIDINGSDKLRIDCINLEPVLHRILQDEIKREEITEWLELLIPEFSKIEVEESKHSNYFYLRIFEKHMDKPIGKNLISDGTYNILALLTAVYQSDEPQFLCIEEPENGLTPFVIYEMVNLFRQMCEEKGHYIWLNTHSPYLVRQLQPKEIILIDKKEGITRAKQVDKDLNFKTMKMDEAWLSNALGGGLPW
jgi:predicted ATPase